MCSIAELIPCQIGDFTFALVTSDPKSHHDGRIGSLIIFAYVLAANVKLWAMLNLRWQHDVIAKRIADPALAILKRHTFATDTIWGTSLFMLGST